MKYIIQAKVDLQWFQILEQISKNQEGFIWISAKITEETS